MGTGHYSLAHKPKELRDWAKKAAAFIKTNVPENMIPVLVYTGMSGISHATAVSLALQSKQVEHFMFYRRKEGEECHGNDRWEHSIPSRVYGLKPIYAVFVDDLVSQGTTRKKCLRSLVQCIDQWIYNDTKVNLYQDHYLEIVTDRHVRRTWTDSLKREAPADEGRYKPAEEIYGESKENQNTQYYALVETAQAYLKNYTTGSFDIKSAEL